MEGIVVGIDESVGATAALHWAVREARVHDRPLTAVLGWGTPDRHYVVLGERFHRGYELQDADDALLALIEGAVGIDCARRIRRKVVRGGGTHALVTAAPGADLLVVGARGGGGFRGLLLGSVAEQCLHHAPCPVAVVPAPPSGEPTGTLEASSLDDVLVGVDGSDAAQDALRWAIDEAAAHGAILEVVHICRPPAAVGELRERPTRDLEASEEAARTLLDAALDQEDTSGLARPAARTVVHGAPAASLLRLAEHADLVVLGARGRGGFEELRLGSVGHQVTRHAPCPVVVVPVPGTNGS